MTTEEMMRLKIELAAAILAIPTPREADVSDCLGEAQRAASKFVKILLECVER